MNRELERFDRPSAIERLFNSFTRTVQRYFPVPAGSPTETFQPLAALYPVFELIPKQ